MDQIQASSSSGGLLHLFFDREIAEKLQLKCLMLSATPGDPCQVRVWVWAGGKWAQLTWLQLATR